MKPLAEIAEFFMFSPVSIRVRIFIYSFVLFFPSDLWLLASARPYPWRL